MKRQQTFRVAFILFVISTAAITGAWCLQFAGYAPCELCLAQRWPYYIGAPLAAVVTLAAANNAPKRLLLGGFTLLALIFAVSAVLGAYHAGVEWKFWPGPSACTGSQPIPKTMEAFRRSLDTVKVVPCDAISLRIFGLSLAAWNAIVSVLLTALAVRGALGSRGPRTAAGA